MIASDEHRELAAFVGDLQAGGQRFNERDAELFVPVMRGPAVAGRACFAQIVHQGGEAHGDGGAQLRGASQHHHDVDAGVDFGVPLRRVAALRKSASISGKITASAPQSRSTSKKTSGREVSRARSVSCQTRSGTSASLRPRSPFASSAHGSPRRRGIRGRRSARQNGLRAGCVRGLPRMPLRRGGAASPRGPRGRRRGR